MKTNPSPHAGAVLAKTTKARRFLLFIAHLDLKVDPLNLNDQFTQALREAAASENVHWKVVRRDVVLGLGYLGRGAQDRFSHELGEGFRSGNFSLIVDRTPKRDRALVKSVLTSLPCVGVTTARWLNEQLAHHNLVERLTTALTYKFRWENREALRGDVHMSIARWGAGGVMDEYLAKDRPPSFSLMTQWVAQKTTSRLYRRGQDALHREMRGTRTESECRHGAMSEAAMDATDWRTAVVQGEEDSFTTVVVDPNDPRDNEGEPSNGDRLGLLRDLIRVARPRAADRYVRVLDYLSTGMTKDEIADTEGIQPLRAGKLTQRVRDDIKKSEVTVEDAVKILQYVADEPYATTTDILDDLSLESENAIKALRLLALRGLIAEEGESFVVTAAGGRQAFSQDEGADKLL
tara:strand:- start:114 stop:1331 length:1218 start_codon:yes stop_codon:yes gene_type:complete